ncbi:MAG: diversity-generating retroelement protein Avd [Candidatus Niyogibacteria bacterium]|nr:diversity-generating retroelement protein Avd [Candidatus Niyogibacteria bacterium]
MFIQIPLLSPPPHGILPIIQKFISAYKCWDEFVTHFPKKSRYTLGEKIGSLFIDTVELLFTAGYLRKEQKLPYLQRANSKLDLLKFFLQIAWELKALDNKKYIALSKQLDEIGKMLGGWTRGIQKQTFPQ